MSKYDIIKTSVIGLTVALILKPGYVLAQGLVNCGKSGLVEQSTADPKVKVVKLSDACTINHALDLVISIINLAIQLSAIVAVLMITLHGFKMVSAGLTGNAELYEDGKKGIWLALTGLVLTLAAFTIINIVWGIILPEPFNSTWSKPW